MKYTYIFPLILALALLSNCGNRNQENQAGKEKNAEAVAEEEHPCAHCGMIYEKHPKWHARVVVSAGETRYYCSNRCMFIGLNEQPPASIESVRVVDYYKLEEIDGQTAFYVAGSDVVGPMGKGFVPVATKQDAEAFIKEHQGQAIYTFEEVTLETVQNLMNPWFRLN